MELKEIRLTELFDAAHPHRIDRTAQNFFLYVASGQTQPWHRAVIDGNGNFHRSILCMFLLLRKQNL